MCWCPSCERPSEDCNCDRFQMCDDCRADEFDADELGLDPEEEWDYDATA